ncbi:bifunctional hydroxymethylpyrimidine kinase/phosphomethylpyrimidine kinase [Fusibacter ferrireducens]|uniref:Hydroxymethylpyrimidine/phosphomethylpyrimidine kinase n=1 Tax=Fusibacter ferrireducens TaxID=2785058 RepID=A0ABR9ZRU7_9FIRM|nr:hydroxymethylpyrimidine/phosphomethylpyrimidine kinase [Fusibacter ferrireducens]MBF4693176.1 hydroxymethylpyrimidine/phosphomethylpyrimidine kinase [Fusibacter ferrireducens]
MEKPKLLIIAGSDPTSGAGIQSDCLTAFSLGVYPMTVTTSVTSQNDLGVIDRFDLPSEVIASQLEGLLSRFRFDAIKIGMIGSVTSLNTIVECLTQYKHSHPFILLDPVLKASNAASLSEQALGKAIRQNLMPLLSLITPNLDEYEALFDIVPSEDQKNRRSQDYLSKQTLPSFENYNCAILLKGGHFTDEATDFLIKSQNDRPLKFSGSRIEAPFSHGTGCTLSTAICAYILRGESLEEAIRKAKAYLLSGLTNPVHLGDNYGAINKWR